jgi:hypothetical protein
MSEAFMEDSARLIAPKADENGELQAFIGRVCDAIGEGESGENFDTVPVTIQQARKFLAEMATIQKDALARAEKAEAERDALQNSINEALMLTESCSTLQQMTASVIEGAQLTNQRDALATALDPDTLEAIADEICERDRDAFYHSARAGSLRGLARRQRAALAKLDTQQDPS